ncbi:MAG: DUF721 domain-containing protein [Muribaculaceae bacterium]|nr:DUF721 domain-containing protein [Muribaculaceae bacterium]MDE7110298.1 DUF721 domain-containing protein [Muribaculaceae bacterium]
MKKTEAQQIGDIIHEVFVRSGMEDNEARQKACMMWSDIVGPTVNRHTTRRYVTAEGIMHVFLNSASLKSDLSFMRGRLIEQLNRYAGQPDTIKDLIIH